jgi:uncharacterized damage-inducible protein DinB
MTDRTEFLKKRLNTAQAAMDTVLDQVGDRWDEQVYSDGPAWTARQLLIHMAEAEHGLFGQMRSIVETGESTVPDDFDVDRYNRRSVEKRAEMTVAEARESLERDRAAMLAWLDTLTDADLEKTGRHPVIGVIPIDMYVRVIARHQKDHTADIARALGLNAKTDSERP